MTNRKRILLTVAIALPLLLLLTFSIVAAVTESFVIVSAAHICARVLYTSAIMAALAYCFRNSIVQSRKKAFTICGTVMVLDLVILDAVRYILSGGTSSVLFLPVWLSICFMVVIHYSAVDTGRDKQAEKKFSLAIGIPLLLLSVFFEILSFLP